MEEKLKARIDFLRSMRGEKSREEFVEFVVYQIACYGGDATIALLSHYGERLDSEVDRLITQ